jgi:hypothetical protein
MSKQGVILIITVVLVGMALAFRNINKFVDTIVVSTHTVSPTPEPDPLAPYTIWDMEEERMMVDISLIRLFQRLLCPAATWYISSPSPVTHGYRYP